MVTMGKPSNQLPERYMSLDFQNYLTREGFSIIHIEGDGNCLFRSISYLICGNQDKHARYRRLAVQHIKMNRKDFADFLIETEGEVNKYCERMIKDGVWGGHLELMALCSVLKCRFVVINEKKEKTIIELDDQVNQPHFYIAYDRDKLHYSSLIRLTNKQREPESKRVKRKLDEFLLAQKEYQQDSASNLKKTKLNSEEVNNRLKKNQPPLQIKLPPKTNHSEDSIDFSSILTYNSQELILWCLKTGILKHPKRCSKCRSKSGKNSLLRLEAREKSLDQYVWRCKEKTCKEIRNIRTGNKLLESFPKVELKIILIYIFTQYCFLIPAVTSIQTLGIGVNTIRKLSNLLTEWIVKDYELELDYKGQFGSKNSIVEIDESCFFRRKFNKGRYLKQVWAFGIVERNTGRLYVEVVKKRNALTLVPIIQKWVSLETKYLISDDWGAYKKLKSLKYNHEKVIHSKNFVNPENPLVHTQTIENKWSQIKNMMKKKRGKVSRALFSQKICEIAWRIMHLKIYK